ncbi:hypothetical protein, partial [Salmonella enterica]
KQYIGALTTVAWSLKTLFDIYPQAKTIDHPDIKFLVGASRNDFVKFSVFEAQRREAMGRTTVVIPTIAAEPTKIEINLGLKEEDRVFKILQKLSQVWDYEIKHWKIFAKKNREGISIEDLILKQKLVLKKPYSQSMDMVVFIEDRLETLESLSGFERDRL